MLYLFIVTNDYSSFLNGLFIKCVGYSNHFLLLLIGLTLCVLWTNSLLVPDTGKYFQNPNARLLFLNRYKVGHKTN